MRRFSSLINLQTSLFIAFTICAIAPLLLFGFSEVRRWKRVQIEQVEAKATSFAVALSRLEAEMIETRARAIEAAAAQIGQAGLENEQKLRGIMALYREKFRFEGLYVGSRKGKSLVIDPPVAGGMQIPVGVDYSDRDYYQALVREQKTVVSKVQRGKITGRPNIQIATPVFGANNTSIGYISGSIDLSEVQQIANEVIQAASGMRAIVMDREGQVIAQSNGAPIPIMQSLNDFDFFSRVETSHVVFRAGLDEAQVPVWGALMPIDRGRLDWTVVISIPQAEFLAESQKAQREVEIYVGVTFLLALILAALLARNIAQPIRNLTRYVTALGEGKLDAEQPQPRKREVKETRDLLVSAQKMARNLKEYTSKIEQVSQMKSEFLATMSHEIRTPMNGILGMLGLLLNTRLDTRQRDYAMTANKSAATLLTIINDILDFSKIEAGKLELDSVDFEAKSPLQDVFRVSEPLATEKGIHLELQIEPDFPDRLHGDPIRLTQILLNLVNNAVKFTRVGVVSIAAKTVSQEQGAVRVRFEVSDTGIGISPEATTRLFQAFSQADASTTRQFGGTGLGLSICKKLVELMGGQIGVSSIPGQGSTFWFEVPLSRPKRPAEANSVKLSLPNSDPRGSTLRGHILVAEDNLVNQRIVEAQLESMGFTAKIVGNGIEALEALANEEFDLILMDCQMPEMDGYQATREIRQREANADRKNIIIAMTANALEGDREYCLSVGMNDYIAKPVKVDHLYKLLSSWMKATHRHPSL